MRQDDDLWGFVVLCSIIALATILYEVINWN